MSPEDLDRIFQQEGLYILGNTNLPGTTSVVLTLGEPKQDSDGFSYTQRRCFMMSPSDELSPRLEAWRELPMVYVAGGPFSVQTCEALREEADQCTQHQDLREGCIEALWDILARCAPIIESYAAWSIAGGAITEAENARGLIREMQEIARAEEASQQIRKHQNP